MPLTVGSYRVLIGWEGRTSGMFTIGSSLIGGPDLIGPSFSTSSLPSGTYDDITAYYQAGKLMMGVEDFTIKRGRNKLFGPVQVGTCELRVFDRAGWFVSKNPASPLYGSLKAMRPVVVQIDVTGAPTWVTVYRGWTTEITPHPDLGDHYATIQCKDTFVWFDRQKKPVLTDPGVIYTGQALGLLLDSIGFSDVASRNLQNGSLIPGFPLDGTRTYIQISNDLLDADLGMFFFAMDGKAIYLDRNDAAGRTAAITYTSAEEVLPGVSLDTIFNYASATKAGSTKQEYQDLTSDSEYGGSSAGDVESEYFYNDAAAMSNAAFRVMPYKDGVAPMYGFTVVEGGSGTLAQVVQYDLGERVKINTTYVPNQDYIIQGLTLKGKSGELVRSDWLLSEAPNYTPFIIGQSLIGGTDVLV